MQAAKRQCLNPIETQRTDTSISNLMSLNDFCILRIFEWLELDTLCAVGETCKKFQKLAVIFFKQKYHNKMMTEVRIQVTIDGRIVLSPTEEYVRVFLTFMQNITIGEGFEQRPLDILAFIQKNCMNNIRQIAFEEIKFNKLHGVIIIDLLKTVESVAFFGKCENVHRILKYCDNLKNLKIDKYSKDSNKWMAKKYLTLEHLQYDQLRDQASNKKLLAFLKNNQNVKRLMLEFDVLSRRYAEEILRQLWAIDLEELLLTFDDVGDLMSRRNVLEELCERSSLKRLHLCFHNGVSRTFENLFGNVNFLNNLKCLEGLHLLTNDYQIPSNVVSEHLKVLHMEYVTYYISTDVIAKNLPNLEELYVSFLLSDLKEFVVPFVRHAVKLEKIVARDLKIRNRMEMTNYRLAKYFNDERGLLVDHCKVIIYIGKDEFDASFNTMPSKFDLVEIRQVMEFQRKRASYTKPLLCNFEF